MSDACFHNFDSNRMIYKAISTDDLPSALANLVVKTPFPAYSSLVYSNPHSPPAKIRQSFANFLGNPLRTVFSKIEIFSRHTEILYPIRGES